jgi:hypothetical protein
MVTTNLDTLVVESQTSSDSVVECLTRLTGSIHVTDLLALHEASLAVQSSLNHTVTDSLSDNVLCRLLATELKANTDVSK